MPVEFRMPKLGLTMEQGTIIEWLVDDGAPVDERSPCCSIETDKVETEIGSPGGGRLHRVGSRVDLFACGERIGLPARRRRAPPAPRRAAPTHGGDARRSASVAGRRRRPRRVRRRPAGGCCLPERPTGCRRARRATSARPRHRARGADRLGGRPGGSPPAAPAADAARAPPGPRCWRRSPPAPSPTCSASISPTCRRSASTRRVSREDVAAHVRSLLAALRPVVRSRRLRDRCCRTDRDRAAHGHAGHDRQAHARVAAGDGAADADDGRRHGRRARRSGRAPAQAGRGCRASPTTSSPRRLGRSRSPDRQQPGHRRRHRRCCPKCTSAWRSPSTTAVRSGRARRRPARLDELAAETTRLAEAARAGRSARRSRGRHVQRERARHVRRRCLHAGDQPAERRHPRRRSTTRRCRRGRRRGRPQCSG